MCLFHVVSRHKKCDPTAFINYVKRDVSSSSIHSHRNDSCHISNRSICLHLEVPAPGERRRTIQYAVQHIEPSCWRTMTFNQFTCLLFNIISACLLFNIISALMCLFNKRAVSLKRSSSFPLFSLPSRRLFLRTYPSLHWESNSCVRSGYSRNG
jgi:hypothetical protein